MFQTLCFILLIFLNLFNLNSALSNKNQIRTRIVGGKRAKLGSLPHQVAYEYENIHYCGGSIIHPSIILLAAHCVDWLEPEYMKIRAGSIKRQKDGILAEVAKVKVHPSYYNNDYDVALVKLKNELPINNETIKLVKLAPENYKIPDKTRAIVSGWGYTSENGKQSDDLQFATVPVLEDSICEEKLSELTNRNLCAGDLKRGGIDACVSDSGGPLIQLSDKMQIGIVANGEGCGHADKPGVYTKVSTVRRWIDQTVKELL